MDLVIFEQNKPFILEALGDGQFDYIEAASEVFETEFFRFIKGKKILDQLSQSYPSPRKKADVPLWLYVAGNLSMRLHGVHSFSTQQLNARLPKTPPRYAGNSAAVREIKIVSELQYL